MEVEGAAVEAAGTHVEVLQRSIGESVLAEQTERMLGRVPEANPDLLWRLLVCHGFGKPHMRIREDKLEVGLGAPRDVKVKALRALLPTHDPERRNVELAFTRRVATCDVGALNAIHAQSAGDTAVQPIGLDACLDTVTSDRAGNTTQRVDYQL